MAPSLIAFNTTAVLHKVSGKRERARIGAFSPTAERVLCLSRMMSCLPTSSSPFPENRTVPLIKTRVRSGLDYPLVSSSVFVSSKKGMIDQARIVIGAAGPAPVPS